MNYIDNDYIHSLLLQCKKNGKMSEELGKSIMLICNKIANSYVYNNKEDKEDCISHSQMEVIKYWHKYDETRTTSAFAFITSIAFQGLKKGFKVLKYEKSVKSISLEFIDIRKI